MSTQLDLERTSDALWQLRPGEAMRLPASPSTRWLRLRDGAMWITADGRDDPAAGSRFRAEGWPSASFEMLEAPHA